MPRRSPLAARGSAAVLLVLIALQVHRRGSVRQWPSTVITNAYVPLRAAEPLLLFLQEVARRVPDGDRVVVLAGDDSILGSAELGPKFLFGLSQLPRQIVLPERELESTAPGTLWVACFGRAFADERFRPVASFAGGTLFRSAP